MRYSDIDVHGLIGGHTHIWRGEGAGQAALKREVVGALVCQQKQEKFLWYVFVAWLHWQKHHGEREEIFLFVSLSVAFPQAEVFRELKGGSREVNGGLTLWFKQGTRPVSLTHVCRGRCYTSTDEQKRERAKERGWRRAGKQHHLFIHLIIHLGRAKRTNLWYSLVSLLW